MDTGLDHGPAYSVCPEDPRRLAGAPIGMYHCPWCGCMVLAGLEHVPHDDGCWLALDPAEGAYSYMPELEGL